MNNPEYIVVHTTATPKNWMQGSTAYEKVEEIDKWHKARGWKGFGYHWLIDRDGSFAAGRNEKDSGAHTVGYNSRSIGIVLVGDYDVKRVHDFFDNYSTEQHETLSKMIADLMEDYGISKERVIGHNQVSPKECPGFDVPTYMEKYFGKNMGKPQVGKTGTSVRNANSPVDLNRIMGWIGSFFGR